MEVQTACPNVNGNKIFNLFVRLLEGKTLTLKLTSPIIHGYALKDRLFEITNIHPHHQRLLTGSRQIEDDSVISCAGEIEIFPTVHLLLRLLGGKGGFGSLLRGAATKAGQKKTNNFDACRDMSGRRLRHVNAEKKLEEWKAEEEERRLEKVAEEFLKKKSKVGKKGVGDGEAQKYVEKYREESSRCVAEVQESVRQAVMLAPNGKRKGATVVKGAQAKKLKIWMGKRKVGESDSDTTDEDESDDEEGKKSVVLNNEKQCGSDKEAEGSSGSVTGGKLEFSGSGSSESGSEEEKETVVLASTELSGGSPRDEHACAIEPVNGEIIVQSTLARSSEVAVVSDEVVGDGKQDGNGIEFGNGEDIAECPYNILSSNDVECVENLPIGSEANGSSEFELNDRAEPIANTSNPAKFELNDLSEPIANTSNPETEKPINFDDFSSAAEMEVLGLERLKSELQANGLKCGGTLQERAARLFLLKTTPLAKLPKKLLAKK